MGELLFTLLIAAARMITLGNGAPTQQAAQFTQPRPAGVQQLAGQAPVAAPGPCTTAPTYSPGATPTALPYACSSHSPSPGPYTAVPTATLQPVPGPYGAPSPVPLGAPAGPYGPSLTCPPNFPSVSSYVPASAASPLDRSFAKVEHLLKAAAHLEAAGREEDAARIWQQAEQELAALKQQLRSVQGGVARLPQPADDTRQVALHLKFVNVSSEKLRDLGFDFEAVQGAEGRYSHSGRNPTVLEKGGDIEKTLQALLHDKLAHVIAEPTFVTTTGRQVSFRSNSTIQALTGEANVIAFKPFGTTVDLVPFILPDGALRLQVHGGISEFASQQKGQPSGATAMGTPNHSFATTVVLKPGQTMLLRFPALNHGTRQAATKAGTDSKAADAKAKPAKRPEQSEELWLLVGAQILDRVDVPMVRELR